MTRQEAIKKVGIEAVEKVESLNCEPTNRAGYNGACQGDEYTEWSAAYTTPGGDDLIVYYYTTNEDAERVEKNGGDWGGIDWKPASYEVM